MPPSYEHPDPMPNKSTSSSQDIHENVERLEPAELDQAESSRSADCREEAVEVIADTDVDEEVRQEVADRLERADNRLTLGNVNPEDSY